MSRFFVFLYGVICFGFCEQNQQELEKDPSAVMAMEEELDPFLFLEGVEEEEALAWVAEQNEQTSAQLAQGERFAELEQKLFAVYTSEDRLSSVSYRDGMLYQFWKDEQNPRGLWRRCSWDAWFEASGEQQKIDWQVLLDVDVLNEQEGENFVFSGTEFLLPDNKRVLISLSRGGADATIEREFDMETLDWVPEAEQPFFRPESKGGLSWIDHDTVFLVADLGEDAVTRSGYARTARIWKRGQPIEEAEIVFEVDALEFGAYAWKDQHPGFERTFFVRQFDFQTTELFLQEAHSGELLLIDAPLSADKYIWKQWLLLQLKHDWQRENVTYAAGSLLAVELEDWMKGEAEIQTVFLPAENQAIKGMETTKNYLILNLLEDVSSQLQVWSPPIVSGDEWTTIPQPDLPEFGSIYVRAVDSYERDDIWVTTTDFLTPSTSLYGEVGGELEVIRSSPAFFDATGLVVEQFFAESKDGTRVPYFLISKENRAKDGTTPTLLYGYGGFEISLTPGYQATVGAAWLERGGAYVIANIRGGGEYGEDWHQAALQQHRHKAYEDFAAVAEDLFAREITSPEHLACKGGSNGGLLVGNMYTTYPHVFRAIVCQVPLLDMLRYAELPPGASWIAEYGDPDIPEHAEFLRRYSPYHNVEAELEYPDILVTTSTRDDRVHPGHARKFAAKIAENEHEVFYYENMEGGHGGAATAKQSAWLSALVFEFLWDRLTSEADDAK